jgi:alpha-tubulin suppressor-like RCC1 family protein
MRWIGRMCGPLALAVNLVGCGSEKSPTRPPVSSAQPSRIVIYNDEQFAVTRPDLFLGDTIRIAVGLRDSANRVVAGYRVDFTVLSGGGVLSTPAAQTDSFGSAYVTWRLGNDPNLAQRMSVSAGTLEPVLILPSVFMPPLQTRLFNEFPSPKAVGEQLDDSLVAQFLLPDGRPLVNAFGVWDATLWGQRFNHGIDLTLPGHPTPRLARTDSTGRIRAQFRMGTAEKGTLGVTLRIVDSTYNLPEDTGPDYGIALFWPTWRTASPSWRFLTAGSYHTCGEAVDGTTYCFGQSQTFVWSDGGQVGNGGRLNYAYPQAVLGHHAFSSLSAGHLHTCGITKSSELYCWGDNRTGALGTGDRVSTAAPVRVSLAEPVADVIAGVRFTCALTTAGQALCWGLNASGALGDGTTTDRHLPTPVATTLTFRQLVAMNDEGACGLTATGEAWCWGDNAYGQIGDGTQNPTLTPTRVTGDLRFAEIQGGTHHVCGRTSPGRIYCWGRNQWGQLGDGTTINRLVPTLVATSEPFERLATGMANEGTCAITMAGAAMCWGAEWANYIGIGPSETKSAPESCTDGAIVLPCTTKPLFVFGPPHRWVGLSQGVLHNCGVIDRGDGYCWADDTFGQLGTGGYSSGDGVVPALVARPGTTAGSSAGLRARVMGSAGTPASCGSRVRAQHRNC